MQIIEPLEDGRWARFVEQHPAACAFHSPGWLRALADSYGYQVLAVTSSDPGGELRNAVPFCRIQSWITGRRLVSLPFSDHCQPLTTDSAETDALIRFTIDKFCQDHERLELRPAHRVDSPPFDDEHESSRYYIHWLDLTLPLPTIFNSLHKDSIQRKIRRADKERLIYKDGRSDDLLQHFYTLLMRTRRRHQLPPQPIVWFRNLLRSLGDSISIRIAFKEELPVASIITLQHRNSMIYKYGCSDERYHPLGGMPFLFWKLIEEAHAASIPILDFGRSDLDNPGLIRFKDQWGTRRTELRYYQVPPPAKERRTSGLLPKTVKAILARLPDRVLQMAGNYMYRHIG